MQISTQYQAITGPPPSIKFMQIAIPILTLFALIGGSLAALFLYGGSALGWAFVISFIVWMTLIRYSGWLDYAGLTIGGAKVSSFRRALAVVGNTGWFTGSRYQHTSAVRIAKGVLLFMGILLFSFLFYIGSVAVGNGSISASAFLPLCFLFGTPLLVIISSASRALETFSDVTTLFDLPGNRITLFLRSFHDDVSLNSYMPINPATGTQVANFEVSLIWPSFNVGSVVGIGSPQDRLPPLGAGRLYCADDKWQNAVRHLMRESAIVIIVAGETYWTAWEFNELAELDALQKTIVVVPPGNAEVKSSRWRAVVSEVSNPTFRATLLMVNVSNAICVTFPQSDKILVTIDKSRSAETPVVYSSAMLCAVSRVVVPRQDPELGC